MSASRSINPDAQAIRFALQCSIPKLRKAALDHVLALIRAHKGSTGAIADALGIARTTYTRWLGDYPELAAEHAKHRPGNSPGPKPIKW